MRYAVALLLILMFLPPFVPVSDGSNDGLDAGGDEFDLIFEKLEVNLGESVVYENLTILVKETLYVNGSLTLRNSTLQMNRTYGVNPVIFINGYLDVFDLDNDPTTTEDASLIRAPQDAILIGGSYIRVNSSNVYNVNIRHASCIVRDSVMDWVEFYRVVMDIEDTYFNSCRIIDPYEIPRNCTFTGTGSGTAFLINGTASKRNTFIDLSFSGYRTAIHAENGDVVINGCVFDGILKAVNSTDDSSHLSNISISSSSFFNSSMFVNNRGYLSIFDMNMTIGSLERDRGLTYIMESRFYRVGGIKGLSGGFVRDSDLIECEVGLETPRNTMIYRNHFIRCGLAINKDYNCSIYHNGFMENVRNAGGFTVSKWYHNTLEEGNYYTSYHVDDNGHEDGRIDDGIGDTAIPHIGRDRYPLMQDLQWMMPRIKEVYLEYANGSSDVALNWSHSSDEHYIVQRSWNGNFISDIAIWSIDLNRLTVNDSPNRTTYFITLRQMRLHKAE